MVVGLAYQLHFDDRVQPDQERVGAVLPDLDGGARHHDGVRLRAEGQGDVNELPGPQPSIVIGELRLERDGAGRDIDLVVDEDECAGDRRLRLARDGHGHRQAARGRAQGHQMPLRHRECHVDRPQLRNRDQRRCGGQLGRLDEISLLEGDRSGPAADRRRDRRVGQVDAGVFDGRFARADGGFKHRQGGLHVLELLRRRRASKACSAAQPQASRAGARPIALERRLALSELRSQRMLIEREENVSLLDLLAFLEMNLLNLPVDARLDDHGRDRPDTADRCDLNRHRHFDRDIGDHWLSCRGGTGAGFWSSIEKITPAEICAANENNEQRAQQNALYWTFPHDAASGGPRDTSPATKRAGEVGGTLDFSRGPAPSMRADRHPAPQSSAAAVDQFPCRHRG
jgi:hypothetical protein